MWLKKHLKRKKKHLIFQPGYGFKEFELSVIKNNVNCHKTTCTTCYKTIYDVNTSYSNFTRHLERCNPGIFNAFKE